MDGVYSPEEMQALFARAQELKAQQAAQQQAAAAQAAAEREANRSNTWGEALGNVPVQLLQGAVDLGQAGYGLANMASLGFLDRGLGLSQNFQDTQNILNSWQSAPTQRAAQRVDEAFDQRGIMAGLGEAATSPAFLQSMLLRTIPSMVAPAAGARLAAGVATEAGLARGLSAADSAVAGAKAGEAAALISSAGQVGGQTNVDTVNQVRQAGGSETQQQLGGLGAGVASGLASFGLGKLTGAGKLESAAANALPGGAAIGTTGAGLREITLGAVREAAQEAGESASQQIATNVVTPGVGVLEGVGKQAALGGLLGGFMGGAMGGAIHAGTPRSSESTPLGQSIRQMLGRANAQLEAPLATSALAESAPLPLPEVQDLAEPQVPEEIDVGAAPAPLRGLQDILGSRFVRSPQRVAGLPEVEELPPPKRGGLLGALDRVRYRGMLGGSDLVGGDLDWQGAYGPAPTEQAPATPDPVPAGQQALDFDAPIPTWKQQLAKDLGLKPGNFRGPAWTQFTAAAEAAGVRPGDAAHEDFLRTIAPELVADPSKAPLFAARLAEKYLPEAQPAQAEQVAPTSQESQPEQVVSTEQPEQVVTQTQAPPVGDKSQAEQPSQIAPESQLVPQLQDALYAARRRVAAARDALRNDVAREAHLDELHIKRDLAIAKGQKVTKALLGAIERQKQYIASVGQGRAEIARAQVFGPPATQPATPGSPALNPPTRLSVESVIKDNMRFDPTITRQQAAADAYSDALMEATDAGDLDARFIAVKNHTDWTSLSDAQRNSVTQDFMHQMAQLGGPGRFDTAEAPVRPMPAEEFRNAIVAANRARGKGPEIVAIHDVPQFEMVTGHAAPADARGVFVDGKVYMILQNLASAEDLAKTLAHERGHHGLAALLGDRLPAVLNRLWTNPATRKRIKAKMVALEGSSDPQNGGLRRLAAEEVLADMLAGGEQVNGDVLTKARSAIEQGFATVLGVGKLRMSNPEVDSILRDVGAYLRGSNPTPKLNEPALDLFRVMGDPASLTNGDPKFSRALADHEEIMAAATAEQDGTRRRINDVTMDVSKATMERLRGVPVKTFYDKLATVALDAVPLNQLANLYDRLLGGLLATFARLKRNKEANHNKLLTGERELTYEGKTYKVSGKALSEQWQTFSLRKPSQAKALSQLSQESTLYKLFPGRPFEKQAQISYAEAGFTEAERREALTRVNDLWKGSGTEGQEIFNKSQALYADTWRTRFEALRNNLARAKIGTDEPAAVQAYTQTEEFRHAYGKMIDSALNKLRQGPYSPLQRYGDYLVTVRDADGKVAFFHGFDTIEEAQAAEAELRAGDFAGPDYKIARTKRIDHDWQMGGINQETIQALENAVDANVALDDPGLQRQVREALVEAYLQSLPQSSFMQHANKRRNTRGGAIDAMRSYNDYMVKSSRSISSLNFDDRISRAKSELQGFVTKKAQEGNTDGDTLTKMQRVVNAVDAQHKASQNFERSPVADALSSAGFLWFLTSPSQLLINSTQVLMVTLPRLAGTYGSGQTISTMRNALTAFAKSRGDLRGDKSVLAPDSTERRILDRLYERGVLDFTLAHEMNALANGEGSALSGHWRKAMEATGWFMHKSEVFNRQVTALAAARLEAQKRGLGSHGLTDEQINTLADATEDAVINTQFDYSQSNKAKLMQGPWRKLIFQFQQYRLNMLAMMGKDIRDSFTGTKEEKQTARRALAWQLGTQLAMTGAAGTVLAPIVFGIADLFRDDDDLLDSRSEFLRSVPQWLSHGVVSGLIDPSRIGADGLLSFGGDYAPKDASAKETLNYYLLANLGPAVGLMGNWATGTEKLLQGDYMGAVKGLAPAPVRDVVRSIYESQQGARDTRQIVYFEPGPWSTVAAAAGLRSGSRLEAEERRSAGYEAGTHAQALRQRYIGQMGMAYGLGDPEAAAEAQQKITEWNQAHPDLAVKASDLRGARISLVRSQMNADQYGVASPKLTPSIREALGLQ